MMSRFRHPVLLAAGLICALARADDNAMPIDLATTLRLAGAQSLQVELATSRVNEAEASYAETFNRFLPFVQATFSAAHHDGEAQDVAGVVKPVNRQSAVIGASLNYTLALGDTLYRRLQAKQLVKVASAQASAERANTIAAAGAAYVELARAQDAIGVAQQAVDIAESYADQVKRAVAIGLALQGDYYRVQTRVEQNRALLVQARSERRIAAARLAQLLHLEPETDLAPGGDAHAPLTLTDPQLTLAQLLQQARKARPELEAVGAAVAAADSVSEGARSAPRYPTLNARANLYGLNGGPNDQWSGYGRGEDYTLELSWRFGPGGLFDNRQADVAEARAISARIERTQTQETIVTQVITAHSQRTALREQVTLAERALAAAQSALDLALARREFGVSAVLEVLLAEEALTQSRLGYLAVLTRTNQAEFELQRATGG
jgi:outer membrane protein TolC